MPAEKSDNQENKPKKKGRPRKEDTAKKEIEKTKEIESTPPVNIIDSKKIVETDTETPVSVAPVPDDKLQSRYGRIRKNRSLGPDMEVTPLVKPKPVAKPTTSSPTSTPKKEESAVNSDALKKTPVYPTISKAKVEKIMKDLAGSTPDDLKVGDLIWARIPGHPWWPCIISEEPGKGVFSRLKSRKNSKEAGTIYHVHYFGKGTQRGWTVPNGIMQFRGKAHFDSFIHDLSETSSPEQKDTVQFIFRVPQSRLTTWKAAVEEAEEVMPLSIKDRMKKLSLKSAPNPESPSSTPTKEGNEEGTNKVVVKLENLMDETESMSQIDQILEEVATGKNVLNETDQQPTPGSAGLAKDVKDIKKPTLSKYKDKAYFENFTNELILETISQNPKLSYEASKILLLRKWEKLSDEVKLTYNKKKGKKLNETQRRLSSDSLPDKKLEVATDETPRVKENDASLRSNAFIEKETEAVVKKIKPKVGPASKTRSKVNGNDEVNVAKTDKEEITKAVVVKEEPISANDYKNLISPTKNGASPRKVAVFIVDDSDSDSGLEEPNEGVDSESSADGAQESQEEQECKKRNIAVSITRLPVEIKKDEPVKETNDETQLEQTNGEDKAVETKKLRGRTVVKKNSKKVAEKESTSKPVADLNEESNDTSKEKSENAKESNEEMTLPDSIGINQTPTEKVIADNESSPPSHSVLSQTPSNNEDQRQQNCDEIIESVGLKKISPAERDQEDTKSTTGKTKGKTPRIGTRRYIKSRMDEVDNKGKKSEEQEKFPVNSETVVADQVSPPVKKTKVNEITPKVSGKPKGRPPKYKPVADDKSQEEKKKDVTVETTESSKIVEEPKELKSSTTSKRKEIDSVEEKLPPLKKMKDSNTNEEAVHNVINGPLTDVKATKPKINRKRLSRTKEHKETLESNNLVNNAIEEVATGSSKNSKTDQDVPEEMPPTETPIDILKSLNADSSPLKKRKLSNSKTKLGISFQKYLHLHIFDIMAENPSLSYDEAKKVLNQNWEKLNEEEKLSFYGGKDDMKENVVKSPAVKRVKLTSGTEVSKSEGVELEEDLTLETTDVENGTALSRHERLCQICEVSGDVITCKGPCQQNFHLGCLNSKPENLSNFQCDECTSNCHTCFTCKSNKGEVRKCTVSNCGKFYHDSCLRESPLSTVMENRIICPLHVCLSCYNENPKLARSHRGRLVRCIRCPTAFHAVESCVAAGSIQLTQSHILCTHHFTPKKGNKYHSHINVNWCFMCSAGGELICCESCPAAFHSSCLDITLPEGGYYCEDCRNRKHPTSGNIVWVKLGCYRWWPAEVCHPNGVPLNIQKLEHSVGEFPVRFFGSHDYFWVHKGRVFLFHEGDKGSSDGTSNRYLAKVFHKAVEEATAAFKKWQKNKQAREVNHNSSKPPSYKHIKTNRPVGKVQIHVADTSSLTRCECNPNMENPCSMDNDCLNRLLHLECHPAVCPAGERCQNQDFVKRNYPSAASKKVEGRGWGLFALANISKGQFVSEYVGELIDEEECQNRLRNMHAENDTNFYFLTIDKDRIIDAGPKGNLSRFMNHSCQPNCETQKWMVNGDTRVGLFASEHIEEGAELTFNYNLECRGDEKTKCGCGAQNCSGFIGVRPKTPAAISAEKKFKENLGKKKKRKMPATRKHEDECYRCGEAGELLMCDKKGCTKSFHLFCLSLDKPPHGRWECPWHHCDICGKHSVMLCQECPNSFCSDHATPENITPGAKVLCSEHDRIMIEEKDAVINNHILSDSPDQSDVESPS